VSFSKPSVKMNSAKMKANTSENSKKKVERIREIERAGRGSGLSASLFSNLNPIEQIWRVEKWIRKFLSFG